MNVMHNNSESVKPCILSRAEPQKKLLSLKYVKLPLD